MKMTDADYNALSDLIDAVVARATVQGILNYRAQKNGKDVEKRFRWDLWWMVSSVDREPFLRAFYKYANDNHLDTALKLYVKGFDSLIKA